MSAGPRRTLVVALLILSPFLIGFCALLVGGTSALGVADSLRVLAGASPLEADPQMAEVIVFSFRMPRVILLMLAGAALAVSGAALQASLQNPLAAPGLLGMSTGASVGAVAAHVSGWALAWAPSLPLLAFLGALIAMLAVYLIASAAGRPTTGTLLLTGVAVSSLGSSLVSIMIISTADYRVHEIFHWLLGSAEGATWSDVRAATLPVVLGIALLLAWGRVVDALALGEEHAMGAGVDVFRARAWIFALVAVAAGAAVSVTGPIGFVGLMVPHMVRALAGPVSRRLLPACAFAGAGFLVAADALSRLLSRSVEVPVGIVTALAGVPFFLVLLHRRRG